jgi:hypothetical protein
MSAGHFHKHCQPDYTTSEHFEVRKMSTLSNLCTAIAKNASPKTILQRLGGMIILLAVLGQANIGLAQSGQDGGVWFSANTQGVLGDRCAQKPGLRWWFDGHLRYLDDSGGYNQSIIRPALGYAINPNTALWWGYAWINELPTSGAPAFNENRMWEQLTWSRKCQRASMLSRTRLEQRFVETGDDTGWRFRQLFKVDRPLDFQPRLSLVAWDEAFFDLNSTDWGQQGSFSQNRLFIGMGWKFSGKNKPKIEVGYLNQFLRRQSAFDQSNHIASLNWFWTF